MQSKDTHAILLSRKEMTFFFPHSLTAFDPRTWYKAVMYVFISYSISQGGLIMIGSYNKWNTDFITASYFAIGVNAVFSFVSAFAAFGAMGTLAYDLQVIRTDTCTDTQTQTLR